MTVFYDPLFDEILIFIKRVKSPINGDWCLLCECNDSYDNPETVWMHKGRMKRWVKLGRL